MERHMQLLVLVAAYWLAAFPIKLCNHINYLRLQVKLQMLHLWGKSAYQFNDARVSDLSAVYAVSPPCLQ